MISENSTIAAISTPTGVGGISVVRLSGPNSLTVASRVFSVKNFNIMLSEPNRMVLGKFRAKNFAENCLMVYFKNPHSYTGEDVVEFQCHGGLVIANGILETLLANGATLAEPGEFTKRAFVNGKMTLDEAEGVMDMINAESESEVRAGYNLLEGNLSKEINLMQNDLTTMIAKVEVALDYPENDFEDEINQDLETELETFKQKLQNLLETTATGKMIKNGSRIVILGKPNVGKSSMMNAMLNYDRAIVTNIKGTTRDILEDTYLYKGVKFILTDTAGVHDSEDEVEKIGIEKAKSAISYADIVLFVVDGSAELDGDDQQILKLLKNKNAIVLLNKSDLKQKVNKNNLSAYNVFNISALHKTGILELKEEIYKMVINENVINSNLILTNQRHIEAIKKALKLTEEAIASVKNKNSLDLVSIDLNSLWQKLGEVTGNTNNETIIDKIFSSFCLGK